jgi:hypothetical protein
MGLRLNSQSRNRSTTRLRLATALWVPSLWCFLNCRTSEDTTVLTNALES